MAHACAVAGVPILIVEDEPLIVSFLAKGLRAEGYAPISAGNGDEALDAMRAHAPALVLLDVMLPGADGFEILGALRAIDPALPVVMLTARSELADRIQGLDLGATDYVGKPFALAELVARIRAHLRSAAAGRGRSDRLSAGRLELDLLERVALVDGSPVTLSLREFALLGHFMRHHGQVLSRQQLQAAVWGYAFDPRSNVVDVYVGYLRRKLGEPGRSWPIETVRGMGYRLRAS
jgi:DNA-binding response OmpR family regulator